MKLSPLRCILSLFYSGFLTVIIYLPADAQDSSPITPTPPQWSVLEDADQDGLTDLDEFILSLDPLNPLDGLSDVDGDELWLAWEWYLGTDSELADTDGDGWSDSLEVLLYGTDPLNPTSKPAGNISDRDVSLALGTEQPSTPAVEPPPSPPTPPPSLSNGDFSDIGIQNWRNQSTSKSYQGGGFQWGEGTASSWSAYVGSTIEVWQANGETFVELDGNATSYGIKQSIANARAGAFILAWKQCGRNDTKSGTNPYFVRVYYEGDGAPVVISDSKVFSGYDKLTWTHNAHVFQITPEQITTAKGKPIYVAFIPTSLNTYGTLIDKVAIQTMDLIAHKRGTIDKPGAQISGKEVVTIENADLDQFDHEDNMRTLTPADVTNIQLQDARKNRSSGQKLTAGALQFDNDFVKLYCDGSLIPKDTKLTIEFEIVSPTGTEGISAENIFFYTKDGNHVQLSQLTLANTEIPTSGVMHDLFDKNRGLFLELGDLGSASVNAAQTEINHLKECTVKLKINGITTMEGIKVRRGGFWIYDRTSNNGLSFHDGIVTFKNDGALDKLNDGIMLFGPYEIKSGQRDCNDDKIKNKGPTPAGWWMLTERTGSSDGGSFEWRENQHKWMRSGNTQSDRTKFPSPLSDPKADRNKDQSPRVYQGGYSIWNVTGHFEEEQRIYDPAVDGELRPIPLMFKFDLIKILTSQTVRDAIQIHPDGHNDGTLGCIGLQNYQEAIRTNFLLKQFRAIPISVRGAPSNSWNTPPK